MWNTGGCSSWYLDEHGVNRTLWSGMTWQYWLATRRFKPSEYTFSGIGERDKPRRHARHKHVACRDAFVSTPSCSVGVAAQSSVSRNKIR